MRVSRLAERLIDHGSFVERGSFGSSLVSEDEFLVIESDGMQEGGVQVVDMSGCFDGVHAEVICGPDRLSAPDSASGHPHRKPVGIVVSAIAFFRHRSPPEFAAPDDECFVEESSLLEVL